jgi:phosphoribosyl-ATP pyrophosphohydrolase
MDTQTDIAEKIIENGADYILAVRENQKQLLEEIIDEFHFVYITAISIGFKIYDLIYFLL